MSCDYSKNLYNIYLQDYKDSWMHLKLFPPSLKGERHAAKQP